MHIDNATPASATQNFLEPNRLHIVITRTSTPPNAPEPTWRFHHQIFNIMLCGPTCRRLQEQRHLVRCARVDIHRVIPQAKCGDARAATWFAEPACIQTFLFERTATQTIVSQREPTRQAGRPHPAGAASRVLAAGGTIGYKPVRSTGLPHKFVAFRPWPGAARRPRIAVLLEKTPSPPADRRWRRS